MPKESVEKKAPRKKAVRKTPAKKRAVSSAPRATKRKAPTKTSTEEVSLQETAKKKFPIALVSVFVVFSFIVGGSVLLGMSDNGEINISSVAQEKANQLSAQGDTEAAQKITIPKVEKPRRNGGLNSKPEVAKPTPPPVPVVIASSTATTTVAIATTTESIVAEEVEEEGLEVVEETAVEEGGVAPEVEETVIDEPVGETVVE